MADLRDEDFAFALSLQDEISTSSVHIRNATTSKSGRKRERSTSSIVDECWETIDPTPDIWQMFLQFNETYFEGKLAGCEVKWSPRMTLCAGVCCYEGRGGLCSIKLSLPLLKLRPRKDLVQTLLHEMIHALLFVTYNNKDHNAHGPEFHKHMYRINQQSGANITVYHNFHDEVDIYRQHWWRCNGPCQKRPPYYGLVKRAMNRAPSERDPWWPDHQQKCGGSYTKIKEPEDYGKKKRKIKDESSESTILGKNVPSGSGMVKISDLWKKESASDSVSIKDKENNMHKSNTGLSVPVVTPFVGKGHVLGTSKDGNSTETRSKLVTESLSRNKANSLFKSVNRDASIGSKHGSSENINGSRGVSTLKTSTATEGLELKDKLFKTPQQKSDGKLKKKDKLGSGSGLTITNAFKRVGKVEKVPIVVVDDSPVKPDPLVPCPICQTNVQKNLINSHLDSCLL